MKYPSMQFGTQPWHLQVVHRGWGGCCRVLPAEPHEVGSHSGALHTFGRYTYPEQPKDVQSVYCLVNNAATGGSHWNDAHSVVLPCWNIQPSIDTPKALSLMTCEVCGILTKETSPYFDLSFHLADYMECYVFWSHL